MAWEIVRSMQERRWDPATLQYDYASIPGFS